MGQGRLELPTSRLSGVRSNHLSYWPGKREGHSRRRPAPDRAGPSDRESLALRLGPSKLSPIFRARSLTGLVSPAEPSIVWALTSRCPSKWRKLLRKEVIQPQVPLRLPCYDFTPVTDHSLGTYLPCGLVQPLLEQSTPMV